MNPIRDPADDGQVVFVDETNCVVTGPGPLDEGLRKLIRDRLEKDKRLLELKEQMYGKSENSGQNGKSHDGKVNQTGKDKDAFPSDQIP